MVQPPRTVGVTKQEHGQSANGRCPCIECEHTKRGQCCFPWCNANGKGGTLEDVLGLMRKAP